MQDKLGRLFKQDTVDQEADNASPEVNFICALIGRALKDYILLLISKHHKGKNDATSINSYSALRDSIVWLKQPWGAEAYCRAIDLDYKHIFFYMQKIYLNRKNYNWLNNELNKLQ